MIFLKILCICIIGITSVYLFYKASGTLNPLKVNIISLSFYELFIQIYIGSSLIWLGFTNHYMIKKIIFETTIDKSVLMVFYLMLTFPLPVIVLNKLFKINVAELYTNYLKKETNICDEKTLFWIVLIICLMCLVSIVYVFIIIGEIPHLSIFTKSTEELARFRIALKNEFKGNIYIRNILALFFTPAISYMTFIYAKCTRKKKWIVLFTIMFLASFIILTYDFEKAPLIRYILGFAIFIIILDNGIKLSKLLPIIVVSLVAIIVMYVVFSGYDFSTFSITSGPIGRILFTPAGALFLHVDTFPQQVPYLNGRSFSQKLRMIFGSTAEQLRSGEVVMEVYNYYDKVIRKTAGVVNAVFIGEAYANFGYIGLFLSTLYVGTLFGAIFLIFLKLPKDTINVWFFSILTLQFTNTLLGGFVDFIYNPGLFILGILFITMRIILNYKCRLCRY